MTKRQYCKLSFQDGHDKAKLTWWFPDGKEHVREGNLGETLIALGDEGWEIASAFNRRVKIFNQEIDFVIMMLQRFVEQAPTV